MSFCIDWECGTFFSFFFFLYPFCGFAERVDIGSIWDTQCYVESFV